MSLLVTIVKEHNREIGKSIKNCINSRMLPMSKKYEL